VRDIKSGTLKGFPNPPTLVRGERSSPAPHAIVSLVTLAFFAPVAAGCISNEYVIPRDELNRLVMTPPELRGQQVHVIQDLGSRRADAIPTDGPDWERQVLPPPQQPPAPEAWQQQPPAGDAWQQQQQADAWQQQQGQPPPDGYVGGPNVQINVYGNVDLTHPGPGPVGPGWTGPPQPLGRATASSGGWKGSPPPSGGSISGGGGGWRGTAPSSGGGSGWRGVPAGGGKSGGGGGNSSGKLDLGSGGGGGEAMVLLAVVLAAIAVVAAISLVSSEGVRFDGMAQMSPGQPVHLKQQGGGELVIALGDLTPVSIAGATEAKVMDDEGYGIRTLDHLRLDRRWAPVFKLDAGSMTFASGNATHSGFIADMQFGVFVRPWLGLLLTAGVGGAGDEYGATLTRHTFGGELQSLPLEAGPFQFGGYFNVGAAAIASTAEGSGGVEWGNALGGGLLGELQVTSRLCLTLRAGGNMAYFDRSGTTSPAATFAAGIALY